MGKRIEVTPDFCILWALLLLLLPLRLILAAMAAALVHELCHGLAIRLCGGRILGLTIGAGGMAMETAPMAAGEELFCALAGPAGSFLAAAAYPWFPSLALCGLVQGCFNLLPLHPLDGGRALACLLEMLIPQYWARIFRGIEIFVLLVLLAAAVWIRMGVGPILVWGMLAVRKIPCKDGSFGVQ